MRSNPLRRGSRGCVVVVTERLLFPATQGYRARIVELIRALRRSGYRIVLVTRQLSDWRVSLLTRLLVDHLVTVKAAGYMGGRLEDYDTAPFATAVARSVRRFGADAVIAECVWMTSVLDAVPDGVTRLVDSLDLLHVRREMYGGVRGGAWVECDREEEARSLARADVILAIQRHEKKELESMLPDRRVVCVPHPCRPVRGRLGWPRTGEIVAFVGSDNPGNAQGLARFVDEAWPRIRAKRPHAELRVYGKVVRRLGSGVPGVALIGPVRRLSTVYRRARVIINPVSLGTGLKIKSVEALANGRALVTTSCGAAGLEEGAGWAFEMEDSMDRFGDAVARLLADEPACRALEEGAIALVESTLTPDACLAELLGVLDRSERREAVVPLRHAGNPAPIS